MAARGAWVPKEFGVGAVVEWAGGAGQVWSLAPAEGGHRAVWVVPTEGAEFALGAFAVKVARVGRKGGAWVGGAGGRMVAQGGTFVAQVLYPVGAHPAAVAA